MSFDSISANIRSYCEQVSLNPKSTLSSFGIGLLIGAAKERNIRFGILVGTALASANLVSALVEPLLKKIQNQNIRAVLGTFLSNSVCYIILKKNAVEGLKIGSLFAIATTASRIAHAVLYPLLQPKINEQILLDMLNLESSDIPDDWSLRYLDGFANSFVFNKFIREESTQSSVIQALFLSTLTSLLPIATKVNKRLLDDINKKLIEEASPLIK